MIAFIVTILFLSTAAQSTLAPPTSQAIHPLPKETHSPVLNRQGIAGNITINPPTETACITFVNGTQPIRPTQEPFTLKLTRSSGKMITVAVNWKIYDECFTVGTFSQGLSPGHYLLDLVLPSDPSWCHNTAPPMPGTIQVGGCPQLPIGVDVEPGIYSHMLIFIGS
jgi:hypothetical protein